MSAPARESKRSGSVRKATALGAPHAKKKRRLNGPDEKRGRGGGGDTQSQAPAAARRSQGQQERPTRGRGGQKARRAMTAEFEEVTGVEQGRGTGSRVDDTEFGQQTQLQYDALDLFDYGDAPPLSPSPTTVLQASASLQHSIEDDVSDGGNATGGPVSRVQGRQLGGRAMQSAVVVGSVGGRGGGRRTQKTTNVKRWGWDRSSEVRTLFEGDPARPGHPLRVETENKLGDCVLKIRCRICRSLISYHNSSWTSAATHIRSHNIATAQDIAAAAALAAESEANGEAFPIHKLPTPPPVKKEAAGDAALMRRTFAAPSYGTDTQPFHRIKRTIAKWIAADCLPYRTVETGAFRAMTRSLDPKCPDFGRKAMTSQVRRCPEYCSVLAIVFNMFFPFVEVANADTAMWKLWRARLEK